MLVELLKSTKLALNGQDKKTLVLAGAKVEVSKETKEQLIKSGFVKDETKKEVVIVDDPELKTKVESLESENTELRTKVESLELEIALKDMTVDELEEYAINENIDIGGATKKDDIIESILNSGEVQGLEG